MMPFLLVSGNSKATPSLLSAPRMLTPWLWHLRNFKHRNSVPVSARTVGGTRIHSLRESGFLLCVWHILLAKKS